MAEIFSNGGGTQSAAISALIVQGRIPKPDFVCIVDTGRERSSTWAYLDSVIRPALSSVGLEVHRIRKSEWGRQPDHGLDWLSHNGNTLLLPAFTSQSAKPGKLTGFCSHKWKVETQNRYCREVLGIRTRDQRNWIGFSLDEVRRATRMMVGEEYLNGLIHLPLIEAVPMRRVGAIALVKSMGWPTPPRSACWNCPNQSDAEWADLKQKHPEEFAAACELEMEVQKKDPEAWFHRSCIPLAAVDFTIQNDLFSSVGCSTGSCFT